MSVKQQVLEIKAVNPMIGYKGIAKIVGCSPTTVAYHLKPEVHRQHHVRQSVNRRNNINGLKLILGGACSVCGYSKCLDALHFHHKRPASKTGDVTTILRYRGKAEAVAEAKKCVLLCANCHAELHSAEDLKMPSGLRELVVKRRTPHKRLRVFQLAG